MKMDFLFDIVSTLSFLTGIILFFRIRKERLDFASRIFLFLVLAIYFFVGLSNVLEHGGITSAFDVYEDYLEILFLPFFLFFIFSLITKQEIDKRIYAETTLRQSEELYRTLVENIDMGITLIDKDHNIIMTNVKQSKFFMKPVAEMIGKKCYNEFEKRGEVCEHCPGVAAMESNRASTVETMGVMDDGSELNVRIRAFPLTGKDEKITGFIEIVDDITDTKRMEEELLKSKKLESLGVLAGGIAHDFNNLLTAILGNITMAKMDIDNKSDILDRLQEAENVSMRARDLTQQLLAFSKGGAPIKKTTDIRDIVMESVEFSLRGSSVKSAYEIQEDLWPIDVDEGQLSQVLNNVVTNSKEAMKDGGHLHVIAVNAIFEDGSTFPVRGGRYIKLTVRDEGEGIPDDIIHKIFDPYFTTKMKGNGLGLATAYAIVKNHNGLITMDSSMGQGTTCSIYLPASRQSVVKKAVKEEAIFSGNGRILVMDDQEIIRVVVEKMLTKMGYDVVTSDDGMDTVSKYREAMEGDNPFCAVIMDLTVPGGTGGKKTIELLRAIDPDVKAIVSSGYANDPIMANYKDYGFAGVARKPYKFNDFSRIIIEVLNS